MKFLTKRVSIILLTISLTIVSINSIENTFYSTQGFLKGKETTASPPAAASNSTKISGGNTTKTPDYAVSSCDQVLEINGTRLADMNDFTNKTSAFFTLSVYMVNQFEKKDGNTLTKSISLDQIATSPHIINGSVSCIRFDNKGGRHIKMCLPDKATADMVIKAFVQFMSCRLGDNLTNSPAQTVQNILKASCLGLNVSFDIKKFGGDINLAKASLRVAMTKAFSNVVKNLQEKEAKKPVGILAMDGVVKRDKST